MIPGVNIIRGKASIAGAKRPWAAGGTLNPSAGDLGGGVPK